MKIQERIQVRVSLIDWDYAPPLKHQQPLRLAEAILAAVFGVILGAALVALIWYELN